MAFSLATDRSSHVPYVPISINCSFDAHRTRFEGLSRQVQRYAKRWLVGHAIGGT